MFEQAITQQTVDTRADVPLLAARVLIAPLYLYSGFGKLGNIAGTAGQLAEMGLPLSTLAAFGAVALELGGAAALVLGLLTRFTAAALLGYTILTGVLFHAFWAAAPAEFDQQTVQFTKNLGIAGGLGLLAWLGGGRLALDRMFSRGPRT